MTISRRRQTASDLNQGGSQVGRNRARGRLVAVPPLDHEEVDEFPPELIEWVLVYFDHLVGANAGSPPVPPAEFRQEAEHLASVLRANYGYVDDPVMIHPPTADTAAATKATKVQLQACVTAAQPPVARLLGDSHVPRLILFKWMGKTRKNIEKVAIRQTDSFARWLISQGVTPALGTIVATALAPLAGLLFVVRRPLLAALTMTMLPCVELIDTALAKRARNPRRAVLFDQVGDRVSDLTIFGALAIFGFHHDLWTGVAAVSTVAGAMLSSYIWAQAAALRMPPPRAHVGRAERILAVSVCTWLSLFFPVNAMRAAVTASAIFTLIALAERVFHVIRETSVVQPQWIGSWVEAWDDEEFIPRLLHQMNEDKAKVVVVHTTGCYSGPNQSKDVVVVVQRHDEELCVEFFHPPVDPEGATPGEHKRASGE